MAKITLTRQEIETFIAAVSYVQDTYVRPQSRAHHAALMDKLWQLRYKLETAVEDDSRT